MNNSIKMKRPDEYFSAKSEIVLKGVPSYTIE